MMNLPTVSKVRENQNLGATSEKLYGNDLFIY
jgi:hypothetical protein